MTAKTNTAKTEALDEAISFDFDGETYSVPPAREWDLDALEAYEDGQIARTCRSLLGADQWATFRSKKRTVGDLEDLFLEVQKALGISGN
jgi:hypothetical protein